MEISPFPPRHEPEASPEPELETVTAPLVTDVLFGRDKIMFNHVGNVRFRLVIQSRAKEYEHAPSRRVKSSIVYSVVQNVHGYGGRFLKKEKDKTWKVVTVTEAIQKVGHALRDKKQHDHKMKAKQNGPVHPLSAKNKSVEGGCDLLLKLGEVCAKEMGVTHQGSNYPGKERVNQNSTPAMAHSLHQPSKRRSSPSLEHSAKKRRTAYETSEDESKGSDDEDAAKCILALGGPPSSATKPMEVGSSHEVPTPAATPKNEVQESGWSAYGARPLGPPLPSSESKMPSPPPAMRSDPLYLVQQRAQQMAHQQAQRLANRSRVGANNGNTHPPALPPQPRSNNPPLPPQARAMLQAQQQRMNHQMTNLMQAAAGVIPRMGGYSFANAPAMPQQQQQQQQVRESNKRKAAGDESESSRPVTPPPIIHTNSKDDDGHWIFYPIKVPNLKLAGSGWKLALMPIDGKGQPIELDPSNIQFPEV